MASLPRTVITLTSLPSTGVAGGDELPVRLPTGGFWVGTIRPVDSVREEPEVVL